MKQYITNLPRNSFKTYYNRSTELNSKNQLQEIIETILRPV